MYDDCEECDGAGVHFVDGHGRETCENCSGTGRVWFPVGDPSEADGPQDDYDYEGREGYIG